MKRVIFALGVFYLLSCSKVDSPATVINPTTVSEDAIKYTTNLDTGIKELGDTLLLSINVTTKVPTAGLKYSVIAKLVDSSKDIFTLDTSLNTSTLNLKVPGFNKIGNFSINVSVTSKGNNSNSLTSTYSYIQKFEIQSSEIIFNHSKATDIWKGLPVSSLGTIDIIDPAGKEMMVITPSNQKTPEPWIKVPTITLLKESGKWNIKNYYDTINFGMGGRDVEKFGNNGYVWIDTGPELNTNGNYSFPYNHVYQGTIVGNGVIDWIQVSKDKSFYHSGYSGDLNHDGFLDIAAVHMGTKSPITDRIHTFINKGNNKFEQQEIIIPKASSGCAFNPIPAGKSEPLSCPSYSAGALIIDDVDGDNIPEIIKGDYVHFSGDIIRHSIEVYTDPDKDGKYTELFFHPLMSKWGGDIGTARMKLYDYDNDGDKDLFVKFEQNTSGLANYGGIRILNNNGKGIFTESTSTSIDITLDQFIPAEFDLFDVDNDGDLDLVFNAFKNFSNPDLLIYNIEGTGKVYDFMNAATVNFDKLIYINEGGKFINKNLGLQKRFENGTGIVWIKGFKVGNRFKFVCMQQLFTNWSDPTTYRTKIIEVFPKF